jgi:hypothetical protein
MTPATLQAARWQEKYGWDIEAYVKKMAPPREIAAHRGDLAFDC